MTTKPHHKHLSGERMGRSAVPPERCPHCGSVRVLCSRDRTGRCDDLTRLAIRAMGPGVLRGAPWRG